MSAETQLQALLSRENLALPPAPQPKGLYRPLVRLGNLVYTAGHLPIEPSGELVLGRLGDTVALEGGRRAALLAGLGMLASLRGELRSLDRVRRLVKVFGLVHCTDDFTEHPAVLNGFSELMAEVFGPDAGVGARSAVGTNSLPLGATVEIEAIFEVEPD